MTVATSGDHYCIDIVVPSSGEALIISHLRFSSNEVASHVKQLPFRPINYVIQSVAIEVPVFPALLRTSAILGHFCTNNVRKSLIARRMMNC